MRKARGLKFLTAGLVLSTLFLSGGIGQELSLKEIFQKNLDASGGREKLGQVQNVSLTTGNTRVVASASGELKLMTGKAPVVTEVILVKGDSVRRNSFQRKSDVGEPEKTVYQTLGKLYAGLFSLLKFEDQLKHEGVKSFGPERLYHLTMAQPGPVRVDFYLRTDDFKLKRLVFHGLDSEGDSYEVNYDFAPFEDFEGLPIPPSWFVSRVGARGNLIEASEVRTNVPLPDDFFENLEINIGSVEVGEGRLRGNVLDASASRFGLSMTTNFTPKDVEAAGLRTGDKLSFRANEEEVEVVFYASARELPPRNELAGGARLMTLPGRGGETYVIQFFGGDWSEFASKLAPLTPIELKKK